MVGYMQSFGLTGKDAWNGNKYRSNMTGRHRGPKRKLRAGYRAPLTSSHLITIKIFKM